MKCDENSSQDSVSGELFSSLCVCRSLSY